MLNRKSSVTIGYAAAVSSAILFSLKGVFVKLAFAATASPVAFMALRFGFALPFFALIAWKSGGPGLGGGGFKASDWISFTVTALLGYYLASWLDFQGLQYVSVGLERLILYLHPTMVVVLTALMTRRIVRRPTILALGLSYLGLALCFSGEMRVSDSHKAMLGSLLVLGSAASYALFLVSAEGLIPRMGTHRFTALGMVLAGLMSLGHAVGENPTGLAHYPARVYVLALATAVLCTLLPVYLFGVALEKLGAARLSIASMVGPVTVLPLAGLALGEPTGLLQWGGFGFTVVGGLVLVRDRFRT